MNYDLEEIMLRMFLEGLSMESCARVLDMTPLEFENELRDIVLERENAA